LTREEVDMAIVQVGTDVYYIKGGVEIVGDNVNKLIDGTYSTLATRKYHLTPTNN
jgi:hypothetical protein